MFLCQEDFVVVVWVMFFIFFDFIVENGQGEILLGQCFNCLVQGYWFVSGGWVCKDEMLEVVFVCLMQVELGVCLLLVVGMFYGVWQYFYDDNFFGEDFLIYYIVFGFCLCVVESDLCLFDVQYGSYCWLMLEQFLVSDNVYENSWVYFFFDVLVVGL